MNQGWIKLHRKIIDNPVFTDSATLHLWIYLLARASHKKTSFIINGKIITVNRGQLIFGIHKCAAHTGITVKRIRARMALLETHGYLMRKRATKYSIITICNYDQYQSVEKEEGQAKGKQRATYKNNKNVKKKTYTQQAEEIYSAYPKKADKNNSLKSIQKLLDSGETKETLLRAINNYNAQIKSRGTERDFIIQSNNFFGRTPRWKEFIDIPENNGLSPVELAMQRCKERGDY